MGVESEYNRRGPVLTLSMIDGDEPDVYFDQEETGKRFLRLMHEDVDSGADRLIVELANHDLAMLDDQRLKAGEIIRASWGYIGAMTPPRDLVIKKITGFERLKIEGHSKIVLADIDEKSNTFIDMKISDVAQIMAARHGYVNPWVWVEDSGEILPHIHQAGETDAKFLKRLANRLGWRLYADHTGFHFHSLALWSPPVKVYSYGYEVDGSHPGGDIIGKPTFRADFSRAAGIIKIVGRNPITGEEFEVKAGNQETDRDGLGKILEVEDPARIGGSKVMARVGRGLTRGVPGTRATAEQIARNNYINSAARHYELKLNVKGDPMVAAKQIVEVWGISDYLSGSYYVKTCKSTVTAGGYTQDLVLRKDAVGNLRRRVVQENHARINPALAPQAGGITKGIPKARPHHNDAFGGQLWLYENWVDGTGKVVKWGDPIERFKGAA